MQKSGKFRFPNSLIDRVAKNIETEKLIQPEDRVLIAVSGGPDSVVLLHILGALCSRMFQKLGVAHLNHCIRPDDADRDAKFVSALCRRLKVPFYEKKIDVPAFARRKALNLEEAGRICRYAFFKSLAQHEGYTKIALGHHANDNAESILMYLLRGSGPLGIAGMSAVRDNLFIRPLLRVTREEIIEYIAVNKLEYVFDATNLDLKYTRNRIRHGLLPYLIDNFNPKIVTALNAFASVTRSEDEYMAQTAESFFDKALLEIKPDKMAFSSSELRQMHPAIARRVLRRALIEIKGDLRRIGFEHIESILSLIASPLKGYRQLHLPDGILVEFENKKLQLSAIQRKPRIQTKNQPDNSAVSFSYLVDNPQDASIRIYIAEADCHIEFSRVPLSAVLLQSDTGQNTAFFDMDLLVFPLVIRNSKPGDRFSPLGMSGTQKLKKYFINAKVPQFMRRCIPVVASEEKIIWIAGQRCSHFSRITPRTERILKAEFFLPNTQQ